MPNEEAKNEYENIIEGELIEIEVSKFLLEEGDVLAEDIAYYHNLKKGLLLTADIIKRIQSISFIDKIKVLRKKSLVLKLWKREEEEIPEEYKDLDLSKISRAELETALIDPEADKRVRIAIENEKKKIRGEDHSKKVLEKYEEVRKKIEEESMSQKLEELLFKIATASADVEALEKLKVSNIQNFLESNRHREQLSSNIFDFLISDRKILTNVSRSIVMEIIKETGTNSSITMLSTLLKSFGKGDYFLAHTFAVVLISIMVAKELTKMVYEKTQAIEGKKIKDINVRLTERKAFTLEELIELGVAALLHDVYIKKVFPDINPDKEFSLKDVSKIELHPAEGFDIAKKLGYDLMLARGIYEHHEYLDGSGYPRGEDKYISKYSPILAFVEHFVDLITPNPYIKPPLHPAVAIYHILNKELTKFDKDVIYAFIRAVSIYPIGSWVIFVSPKHFGTKQMVGIVIRANQEDYNKPWVKAILEHPILTKISEPVIVNLLEDPEAKILKPVNMMEIRQKFPELFFQSFIV